jgi:hypothetical protein
VNSGFARSAVVCAITEKQAAKCALVGREAPRARKRGKWNTKSKEKETP